jgi:Flp pilus assembly protein TadD
VYSTWADHLARSDVPDKATHQFEKVKKSFEYNSKNSAALRSLTWFATQEAFAAEAKSIYDPYRELESAPPDVLSDLGIQKLQEKDFAKAIELLELARQKADKNSAILPTILNNLAYAHLIGEQKNPQQALYLVDQALSMLRPGAGQERVASHFLDTKGLALMQMNEYLKAISAFELALKGRPNDLEILNHLIECYEKVGNVKSAQINRELKARIESGDLPEQDSPEGEANSVQPDSAESTSGGN